jgi:hypothetical protein
MTKSKFIRAIKQRWPGCVDVISNEHKYGSSIIIVFTVHPDFEFSSSTLNPYSKTNLKKIGVRNG